MWSYKEMKAFMKLTFVRQCAGFAVGLSLFAGCAKPSAQTQPQTVVAPTAVPAVTPQSPQPFAGDPTAGPQAGGEGPTIEGRVPPTQPANMSPGVDEVARLAQGGVSEDVIIAYIQKYPGGFNVTADQIVYLNDLGVTSNVVTAMLKHDGVSGPAPASTAPPAAVASQPQVVSNLPQNMPANPALPPVVTPAATPPPSTEVSYFYDSLSPYGSWMFVSGYGWCWQPTAAVVEVGWRPYCERGRWYWSDSGWFWHSDYSWGWAPFHYGRWYMHPRCGWIWTPGVEWGPAWVSWRYSEGYCGWAPLPPEAIWTPGVGFLFHGRHVGFEFDFGLAPAHYAFVSVGNFCDPYPFRHIVPRTQVVNIYHRTTVVNNYTVVNKTIVNRGVGRDTIARASHTEIRQVRVQPTSFATVGDRAGRIERRGNDLVAYRPQLPKEPPVRPTVIHERMVEQARVARESTATANVARPSRGTVSEPAVRPGATTSRSTPAPVVRTPEERRPAVVERRPPVVTPPHTEAERVERSRSQPAPVARANEAPARTEVRTPEPRTPAPAPRTEVRTAPVAPRVQATPARPVYPETRAAEPRTVTPRAQPYMSPRYNEQNGAHYNTPAYGAPSYSAPAYQRPEYSTPHPATPENHRSNPAPSHSGGGGGGGPVRDGGRGYRH